MSELVSKTYKLPSDIVEAIINLAQTRSDGNQTAVVIDLLRFALERQDQLPPLPISDPDAEMRRVQERLTVLEEQFSVVLGESRA